LKVPVAVPGHPYLHITDALDAEGAGVAAVTVILETVLAFVSFLPTWPVDSLEASITAAITQGGKCCTNHLLVPRKRLEETIITELQERILTAENLEYIYNNIEKLAIKELNNVPDLIKMKKLQYDKLVSEIQNYLNYIKAGNFSKAVSETLKQAKVRSDILQEEICSVEYQKTNTFTAPPLEWIYHRLNNLRETLNQNTP
jgi:hypothetical protein